MTKKKPTVATKRQGTSRSKRAQNRMRVRSANLMAELESSSLPPRVRKKLIDNTRQLTKVMASPDADTPDMDPLK